MLVGTAAWRGLAALKQLGRANVTLIDRRSFTLGTAAASAAIATTSAGAQGAFPNRPITIINAFPPGGLNDLVTRPFAPALQAVVNQPVVVETKAGAAGQVGAGVVAAAKPDGYTLLSHNIGINSYEEVDKINGRKVQTTRADFVPLARLVADSILLVVNDQQPWKTLAEFIADAKARPSSIVYSSGGLYGASHLPVPLLEKAAGLPKMRHLPTNGGGPAITALLGNNAQMSTQSISASLSQIRAGKLKALASYGGTRSKQLPDVPTMKELGFNIEYYLWAGIFAPKATPPDVVATLNGAIGKAANSDGYKTALTNAGLDLAYMDSAAFAKFWEQDAKATDEAVRLIGKT